MRVSKEKLFSSVVCCRCWRWTGNDYR